MSDNKYPCYCDDGKWITLDHYGNMDSIKICPRCNGTELIELPDELKSIRDILGTIFLLKKTIENKLQIVENEETHNLERISIFLENISDDMDTFINDNFDENYLN